jgi:peptide/nickel transport system substrate-binding protein
MKTVQKPFLFNMLLLLELLIITACQPSFGEPAPTVPVPANTPVPTDAPIPTPTTPALESLTICTGALPEDLFPYHAPGSVSKANILSLIYEAPFLEAGGELTPLILERMPNQANGDLALVPVSVQAGQPVVDAAGQLAVLKAGVMVRPAGCRDADCAVVWDGEATLDMDQMVVKYQLRADLTWSDGSPVTSADSVFSYDTAIAAGDPGLPWALERTETYSAIDTHTVQWLGLPGFSNADLARFFWKPLPLHLYPDASNSETVLEDARINTSPIGYGPFVVSDWEGDVLRLTRNPHYFRLGEGLPKLDQIEFHQIDGGARQGWEALRGGQCDVLDSSFDWGDAQDVVGEIQLGEGFDLHLQAGASWTQLVFGIKPASYDDFYNPQLDDRPDILGDARTRQAIMHCLDRETMLDNTFGDLGRVWDSYLPPGESQLGPDEGINFDPTRAAELLAEVGWVDHDGDPSTPLQALNAAEVPPGTPLSLALMVSPSDFHQELAQLIQQDLGGCGVGVTVSTHPVEALYAPGPEGPLFGRQFDLALISWQSMPGGDCQLYQAWGVPKDENYWIGTNIAGLLNETYDTACGGVILALPDELEGAVQQSETIYLEVLPAVPLFSTPGGMVLPANSCFEEEIYTEKDFFAQLVHYEKCP